MRIWRLLSLLAVTAGCASREEAAPPAKAPVADHGEHAGHDTGAKARHSGHAEHGGHKNMPMESPRKLIVGTDPAQPQAGSATKLVLQIQDDDGTPIKRFDLLHEKLVHLILVREGLDEFAHLHPDVDASGMITTEFAFPKSGKYRLFADHQPQGGSPATACGEIVVAGDAPSADKLKTNVPGRVTGDGLQAEIAVDSGGGASETSITFALLDDAGAPVSDLQTYLGAMGHLVILSADGRDYVHAHNDAKSAPDGRVTFEAHFPKPGLYKGWGQFRRSDNVNTLPFVIAVQ